MDKREKLIRGLECCYKKQDCRGCPYKDAVICEYAMGYDALKLLKEQQERKKGKWVRKFSRPNVYLDLCWYCTACEERVADSWANTFNFCPNCGAEMRGVTNDESMVSD